MAHPSIDPTFYRTAAEAAAAPGEQLAYVVAFDRAAQKNDPTAASRGSVHIASSGITPPASTASTCRCDSRWRTG